MKQIQNLSLFFTLTFATSLFVLILVFQNNAYVVAGLSVLCFFGSWLMVRFVLTLRGFLHDFLQKEARLKLLAARDPATGLFHHNGFEVLFAREIERAKRKDYNLALVLIQVEPYQKIENDIGTQAMDRLLFQIAETLQNTCRIYDGLFKLDDKTFCLYFSETKTDELIKIIQRMQKRLEKSSFLVSADRMKVTPNFQLGAALYPMDGTNPQSLEDFARSNLSETFDLSQIRHPDRPHNDFYDEPIFQPSESHETQEEKQDVSPLAEQAIEFELEAKLLSEEKVLPQEKKPHVHLQKESQETISCEDDDSFSKTEIAFDKIDTTQLKGTPEMQDFQDELNSLFARTHKIEEDVEKLLQYDEPQTFVNQEQEAGVLHEEIYGEEGIQEEQLESDLVEVEFGLISSEPNLKIEVDSPVKSHNQDEKQITLHKKNEDAKHVLALEPLPEAKNQNLEKAPVRKPTLLDARKIEEIHERLKELDKQSEALEAQSKEVVEKAQQIVAKKEVAPISSESKKPVTSDWSAEDIAEMPDVVAALMQNEISKEPGATIKRQNLSRSSQDDFSPSAPQQNLVSSADLQK